jgi:hypothetical protein
MVIKRRSGKSMQAEQNFIRFFGQVIKNGQTLVVEIFSAFFPIV